MKMNFSVNGESYIGQNKMTPPSVRRTQLSLLILFIIMMIENIAVGHEFQPPGQIPPEMTGLWTGKEFLLLRNDNQAFYYDPTLNSWRSTTLKCEPGATMDSPRLALLASGSILATYWELQKDRAQLCFDHFSNESRTWRRLANIDGNELRDEDGTPYWEKKPVNSTSKIGLLISGIAPLSEGGLALLSPRQSDAKDMRVIGIKVNLQGQVTKISRKDAPMGCYGRDLVAAHEDKVFYYGYCDYFSLDSNVAAIWNSQSDMWDVHNDLSWRNDFGYSLADGEIYIFGGQCCSNGYRQRSGIIYSFAENNFHPWPTENGPSARADTCMCWTGKKFLVWGGTRNPGEPTIVYNEEGGADAKLNDVMGYDPTNKEWSVLPGKSAPKERHKCITAWTGKEMLIWGGCLIYGGLNEQNGYAYDPEKGVWRQLPPIP